MYEYQTTQFERTQKAPESRGFRYHVPYTHEIHHDVLRSMRENGWRLVSTAVAIGGQVSEVYFVLFWECEKK